MKTIEIPFHFINQAKILEEDQPGAAWLYICLCSLVNRQREHLHYGKATPTEVQLAELTGKSRITVIKQIKALEKQGFIKRFKESPDSNKNGYEIFSLQAKRSAGNR
jgi:hypothetical protein